MVKVEIVRSLVKQISRTFSKTEAHKVLDLIESLETSPTKGKLVGSVGGIVIKELKYKKFRFYFLFDGFIFRSLDEEALVDLLMRFVRMSDKKSQQETIVAIKKILQNIGHLDSNKNAITRNERN